MEFKIETMPGNDEVKRVVLVPSNEEGGFVLDHPYYGQRIVSKLGIVAFRDDTQKVLESGMATADEYFVHVNESSDLHAVTGIDVVAMLDVPGFGNTITAEVELFREVVPVL